MRMSIASRLYILFLVAALVLGSLAAIIAAQHDFHARLESITSAASARLPGHAGLQYMIYQRDEGQLNTALMPFLVDAEVTAALSYTGPGELITRQDKPGAPLLDALPFSTVRGSLMAADTALVSLDTRGQPIGTGLLASLFHRRAHFYFSLPVITAVNPAEQDLEALDFARAYVNRAPSGSQRVIGYLHLMIDRGQLLKTITPTITRVMSFSLLFALFCSLATWYFTRQITRSLKQLAKLADDVSSGNLAEPASIKGSSEMKEIARVFNGMIGGLSNATKEANVDRQLLSMKVEERSAQLTERNRELNQAVEQANQTRHQLHHLANFDGLTSLPNRRLLTEQLDLLLKLNKRNKHTLALLSVDLNDFKRVNDSLGLAAGDQLLRIVARRLADGVRESDSVGHCSNEGNQVGVSRLGGDEFVVVLNQLDSNESASLVAERLVESLRQPLDIDGHELVISPSVGIALAPADGIEPGDLLRAASAAKLKAKENGTALQFYQANLGGEGEDRLRLESDLRKAIERDEFILHYQPQVDTHSGSVVGAEALLRWNHGELGQVPPGNFLHIAEDIGLMDELNEWVLSRACEQLRRFNESGVKLQKVAINFSSGQLSSGFVQRIKQAIDETGIAPGQLELGLSEAMMTSNEQDTIEALRALKEIGVYLAVDDFGTGFSPISYLSQYPLDELKIDRSFLLESNRSENGAKLVIAIIAMARSLDLKVLASGVESESEFRFLTEHGAHIIQGYLFSKPVPADELKPMLGAWHFVEKVQKLAETTQPSALDRLSQFE